MGKKGKRKQQAAAADAGAKTAEPAVAEQEAPAKVEEPEVIAQGKVEEVENGQAKGE